MNPWTGTRSTPLILLVEDDPMQRLAPTFTLEKAGYRVMQADTGQQGLEIAREHHPDLVVCDVLMPEMNGFQFVAALRKDPQISSIPVIMLTSMAERGHVRTGMTTGADDYLTKPLDVQELRDAVASLLAKRKAREEKLMEALETELVAALDQQKQSIGTQYEHRLLQELNTRWTHEGAANSELQFDEATLLVVDMFGSVAGSGLQGEEIAQEVRRRYLATRDTLYLFGARQLVPFGHNLLAVYAAERETPGAGPTLRAARAAFALLKAAGRPGPEQRGITIALVEGPVTLVQVSDPLHGDPDSTLATGPAVVTAGALNEFARTQGWRVVASADVVARLAEAAVTGAAGQVSAGANALPAFELTGLSAQG